MRLGEIGALELQRLFRAMETAGLSRTTRATTKGIIRAIWACARKWQYVEGPSPLKDADIGGGPRRAREYRTPSLDDVQRLIAACEGDIPLLIEALCVTGMRISEASGLQVSDLDFHTGFISVRRRDCRGDVGDTKSEESRRDLPMGQLLEPLREHTAGKGPTDRVFTWKGEPIIDNTLLANHVTPVMEDLGIKFPGFGWHTFRRLHLTLMNQRGLTLFELRKQAGHADVRTTQIYVGDDAERRAKAAEALPFLVQKKGA